MSGGAVSSYSRIRDFPLYQAFSCLGMRLLRVRQPTIAASRHRRRSRRSCSRLLANLLQSRLGRREQRTPQVNGALGGADCFIEFTAHGENVRQIVECSRGVGMRLYGLPERGFGAGEVFHGVGGVAEPHEADETRWP